MEHSAATHRAVLSDDAVTKMMSFLEPTEDRKAVLTCKTWSTCWRRRCRGLLRVVGQRIGRFPNVTHVSPHGGGVVVSNYDDNSLEAYSPEGRGAVHVATYVLGPGVTWMGPNANHAFDTTIHFDDPDAYLHIFEPVFK